MDQNNEPSRVVFEGEEQQYSSQSFKSDSPKMIQWVIKYSGGIVKNDKQANFVLIIFVIVMVALSLFVLFGDRGENIQQETIGPAEAIGNFPQ